MIEERELWACAQQVLRQHGEGVDRFIAERVASLAHSGDRAGVGTWVAIADRVDKLRDDQGAHVSRH